MYINKIDDLIDKIIDDFYATVILKHNLIELFLKEINFVKYQSDINDILKKYISNLNLSELKSVVSNNDIINKIVEVIKKYITLYLFLYIGFYYTNSDTGYANNIVEFTKNQASYGFKISEFFNSESNGTIIDLYSLIKKIQKILNAETKQKKELLISKPDYKNVVEFLNELGANFVNTVFNIDDKNHIRAHNIIKTIIITKIYNGKEKIDLFRILELLETSDNEFTFIDIVVPIKESIEMSTIEGLLSKKEIMKGVANKIWNAIEELEEGEKIYIKTPEEKILYLINSGLLIPIVDDILLFNNANELYDRTVGEESKVKKREDTKIRYIINKIDMSTNINLPEYHNEAKKLFYQPLINRKVVLVNNIEDIKIVNKFINIGKISTENSEYLRDLEHLIIYPYINVKESKNGLLLQMNKTVDTLRYVNFDNTPEFKQRPNTYIDVRVGTKNMYLNIVGFMINTENSLYCIKNKDVKTVNFGKKKENGYNHTIELLTDLLSNKKNKENLYWIFNPDTDKINIESYDQQNKLTTSDQIKHIVAQIYDEFEQNMYEHIINKVKELKDPILTYIDNIIYKLFNKYFPIEKKSILLDLEKKIYTELIKRGKVNYDKYDDIVNGISKDSIVLLNLKNKNNIANTNIVKMNLSELTDTGEYEEKEKLDGICHHNITWDKISEIKKENPKLFMDILYRFIQQYVVENPDGDYICKSCGFFLNIKKYVSDGTFDDDHHFVSFSMVLETPLEDIPEYEKYKGSIRSIDKFIEKIGLVSGIPYFIGANPTVKSRRKLVVKDVIDIVVNNNFILKKILKDRNELSSKLYGINRNYSNIFSFDLENSIFIFSSKDKDYLKPIKQNNVLAYIIILIMLELNESQVTYFNNDKKGLCNFVIFDKIFYSLFDGLKFRKNNKGDTVDVVKYEIFCYMLYMISCYCTKYNLWYYDYKDAANDKSKRQKLLPTIQKIIIHTVIDILNSIIENSEDEKNKNRIFEILKTKFYKKLNSTFSNKGIYERMREESKPSTIGDKKSFILTKVEAFVLTGKYDTTFGEIDFWRKIKTHMMYLNIKSRNIEKYDSINNVTNCESGDFHNFIYDNKTLKCTKCNKLTSQLVFNKSDTKTIQNKFHLVELTNLSKKYCYIDGNFHEFHYDKNNKKICLKCNKEENYVYKEEELKKLSEKFVENKSIKYKEIENTIISNTEREQKHEKYIKELKEKINIEYLKTPTYIDDLIKNMEDNISEELIKNISSLKNNLYIFDHDYMGIHLDKEIQISEKDNKIQFKSNHPFFNKDVIYYTTYKSGKIEVFYDAVTKILIGYKEENKNYVLNVHAERKIRILYSTTNKLKMLGYKYKNYNIDTDTDTENIQDLIKNIIRDKINTTGRIIYRFQRLIYRLINNFYIKKKVEEYERVNEEYNFFNNKYEQLVEKYGKKLQNINIVNSEGNHLILRHWKNLADNIQLNQKDTFEINTNTVDYEKISKYDKESVLLNFYLINEINKLYKYNTNKQIKINITALIYDFINITFSLTNEEKTQSDKDYKRFNYILNSKVFIDEIKDQIGKTEGIYEEVVDEEKKEITEEEQNKKDDINEENDALDVEGNEYDYEAGYERNLERDFDDGYVEKYEFTFMDYYYNTH
jgi:hypothetical protein